MHVHPNGLSNDGHDDIQPKAEHFFFQEGGGGLRSLLVYTLNPGNLRQCITNFQYSGTSLLQPSKSRTPPLYGQLTRVPNGWP